MVICVSIIWKLNREAIIISIIQHFEADFLWKVSLKILNSGLILKTFTHGVMITVVKQNNLYNKFLVISKIIKLLKQKELPFFFYLCLLVTSADNFCKHFRLRSGLTKCQTWSGFNLFDTLMVFLKQFFEKKKWSWKEMQNFPKKKLPKK